MLGALDFSVDNYAITRMANTTTTIPLPVPFNPAAAVRGPKHVVKRGKTPVLKAEQARALLDSISLKTIVGLRDRALLGVMCYTFARVGSASGSSFFRSRPGEGGVSAILRQPIPPQPCHFARYLAYCSSSG